MMAMDAYGIRSSSAAASAAGRLQQPGARRGGGGEDHRVGVQVLRVGGRPDREPPAGAVRASSRTIAFTRTSAPDALATASGSAPSPVVRVTKTGAGFSLLSGRVGAG